MAMKYGMIISSVCSALFFVGGFVFGGFTLEQAVVVWRSGMCIVSGLSLFVVAGAILTKKNSIIKKESQWRSKFAHLGYVGVLGIIAVFFILWAAAADALLRLM